LRGFRAKSSPDLTTGRRIVIEQAGALTRFSSNRRSSDSAWTCSNNDDLKDLDHSVTTSIAGAHSN
jgi:hypothetical protein